MEEVFLTFVKMVLGVVDTVFDVLFFWLPSDPITSQVVNWDVVASANAQAVRWLNWFVDVQFYAEVFSLFIAVFLAFAAWKVIMVIVDITFKGIEAVPGE